MDQVTQKQRSVRQDSTVMRPKTAVPKMGWLAVVADPEMKVFGIWQHDANAG